MRCGLFQVEVVALRLNLFSVLNLFVSVAIFHPLFLMTARPYHRDLWALVGFLLVQIKTLEVTKARRGCKSQGLLTTTRHSYLSPKHTCSGLSYWL